MGIKETKSFFSGIPSWGLALITAFLSLFFLFILAEILTDVVKLGYTGDFIAYITSGIIIAIACFFICRKDPKSVWYVPILCNVTGIIAAIVEPNFWITYLWIVICGGWILSLIGAISGAIVGRRVILNKQG